ncbi:MAG: hypothetical protein OEN22_02465, partial [Gammaproteobacteria bacterium]|nr:hypothetical protein [Gammaproteobacteria bacterium]
QDLDDVEVVDGSTAFAVGKKGETLQLVAGSWVSRTGFTGDHLFGVWAASATEAWVVGEKGALFSYDGSTWTDRSTAAGTGTDLLVDAWGDGNYFYALGREGTLYQFVRNTGNWAPPDTLCKSNSGFEDLWGDGAGNIYLVKRKEVYRHDGSSCSVVANSSQNLRGVYGVGNQVYAAGNNGVVLHFDGATWQETITGSSTINDVWVSAAGNAYYAGKNASITSCVEVIPVFVVNHDNTGINCLAETITVSIEDTSANPLTNYNEQVTLDTQSGSGSWQLVTGGGAFIDATPNDGIATYDWPLGESSAVFALSYPEGPASVDIDVYQTNNPAIRDNDGEGLVVFSASGFTLAAMPLSNPPALIVPFNATQVAGTDFGVYLAAFGQTPNDPLCGIIESYTGPQNLKFWFGRIDPAGGTIASTIDGNAIGIVEAAASNQIVTFTDGQAAVTAKYKDTGSIQILVKDDSQAHPDLPNGIRGATAGFVVKPFQFVLSNIEDGGGNSNPGAANAGGPAFIAAGEPFAATVTAYDAEGDVTPNYGQEVIPETVRLAPILVAPLAGDNPPLGAPTGFGPFSAGQARGTNFNWPEVGIISLMPSIGDGDYLGAGNVTGSTSGNVGRFIAHHFTTVLNVPTFATGCSAGTFTYIGETFAYSNAPVITFTARASAGEITENYTAAFFKVDNAILPDPVYTATPATLDTSGLPPGASDPTVTDLGAGIGTLTFSSGSGLAFTRGAEEPEFIADIRLSMDVADTDGAAALGNPIVFGDPGGIVFDNGAAMRYGRARLLNAYGSELVDLPLPFRTEYYVDAANGFVPNVDDACTDNVTLSLGAFTENLSSGDTCVMDTGAPGASGEGCAAPAPPAFRFREPPLGGDFNMHLRAPGATNDGSTTATADVPTWLEFDWDAAIPGFEDPSGTAVFGIFKGQDRRIYLRELY